MAGNTADQRHPDQRKPHLLLHGMPIGLYTAMYDAISYSKDKAAVVVPASGVYILDASS
jgi:hypothetical protein